MTFQSQTNRKFLFSLLFTGILFTTSCNNDDATSGSNPSGDNTPVTTNLAIEPSNTFAHLKLTAADYTYWNSNSINAAATTEKIKTLCQSEIYPALKDEYDFIVFVMNNSTLPTGMPYGEYHSVKNDTQGIGLQLFNDSSAFGSAGKLQGVYFLYKNNIDLGPFLHEMFHRWGNWIVPQNYGGHWDSVQGILSGAGNNMADIELYLCGAIPANQITDPESLAIYNDSRYTNKVRVPNSESSQKKFKSLVVLMSQTDLTAEEITSIKNKIANITRTPAEGTTNSAYQNIYNKSRGLLTLTIGGLNLDKK